MLVLCIVFWGCVEGIVVIHNGRKEIYMAYFFDYAFVVLIILWLLLIVFDGIKNVKFNRGQKLKVFNDSECSTTKHGLPNIIKQIYFDENYKCELDELIKLDRLEKITDKEFKNYKLSDFYRVNNLEEIWRKYEDFDNSSTPKSLMDYVYMCICGIYIIGFIIHFGFTSEFFAQLILLCVLVLFRLRRFNFWLNNKYVCKSCNNKGLRTYFYIHDGIKYEVLSLLRCEKCGKKYCSYSEIDKKTK